MQTELTSAAGDRTLRPLTRREFLGAMSAAAATLPLIGVPSAMAAVQEAPSAAKKSPAICFFSKPLDAFETAFMADTLADAGIDGFDLSVRPGGKVEPERVDQELPKFVEAIRKHNLTVPM